MSAGSHSLSRLGGYTKYPPPNPPRCTPKSLVLLHTPRPSAPPSHASSSDTPYPSPLIPVSEHYISWSAEPWKACPLLMFLHCDVAGAQASRGGPGSIIIMNLHLYGHMQIGQKMRHETDEGLLAVSVLIPADAAVMLHLQTPGLCRLANALIGCPDGHHMAAYPVHDALQGEACRHLGEQHEVANIAIFLAEFFSVCSGHSVALLWPALSATSVAAASAISHGLRQAARVSQSDAATRKPAPTSARQSPGTGTSKTCDIYDEAECSRRASFLLPSLARR